MEMNTRFVARFLGLGLMAVVGLTIVGCSTPHEVQSNTLTNFVDKKTVMALPDDQIVANNLDVTSLKKRKKATVGVYVSVSDQSQGAEREQDAQAFLKDAQGYAENYMFRAKAYNVTILDSDKFKREDLLTGDCVELKEFAYLIDMKIDLNTESDRAAGRNKARLYRVSIDWKLIDNRTKKNGLGKHEAPIILEALSCQHAIGRRLDSSINTNSQSIFQKALQNALVEFRAQLANRLTYGGRIVGQRQRDGKVRFTLDAGMGVDSGDGKGGDGIVKGMQMLVINEDGDSVCVAQAMNGIGGKTTIEVWRWLSDSLKEEILQKVKKAKKPAKSDDDEDEDDEEDEECYYAVSLGMPSPDKDERTQIRDFN